MRIGEGELHQRIDHLADIVHSLMALAAGVSRSAGCFGCYVTCPNAVSSWVIHLVFHRLQHNCFSSLDSIKLVY
jgi:hypothetical protein